MTEKNPIYEAAYAMAAIMKDPTLPPEEKVLRMDNQVHEVNAHLSEWTPSERFITAYAEYHFYLNEAIRFFREEQKRI